jgi:hypothetical protein
MKRWEIVGDVAVESFDSRLDAEFCRSKQQFKYQKTTIDVMRGEKNEEFIAGL